MAYCMHRAHAPVMTAAAMCILDCCFQMIAACHATSHHLAGNCTNPSSCWPAFLQTRTGSRCRSTTPRQAKAHTPRRARRRPPRLPRGHLQPPSALATDPMHPREQRGLLKMQGVTMAIALVLQSALIGSGALVPRAYIVIDEKTGLCLQIEGPTSSYCARVWQTSWNSGVDASMDPPNHTAKRCIV